jgi:hypothetical protein
VLKTLNSQGITDYYDGLSPDIVADESSSNLGVIGDVNEPLLSIALSQIYPDKYREDFNIELDLVSDSNSFDILDKEMYFFIDNYTKFVEFNERRK